ncbi:MAG: preprotein translocase subunit SecE [Planctomycetota bacterium]
MSIAIRKIGQGYWTRLLSVIGFGLLGVLGSVWLWRLFETVDLGVAPVYVASGAALVFMAVVGGVLWWFAGSNVKSVDFLVATEGEMKKVNWSTRREIVGSTLVVIGIALVISLFCWIWDFAFSAFFAWIRVLDMRS